MKIKTVFTFLVLAIVVFACKKDDDNPEMFFPAELSTIKASIAASFDTSDKAIDAACVFLAQSGTDSILVRSKLSELYNASTIMKEFCFTDTAGILQIIEPPEYYSSQGINISNQNHVISCFQSLQPVLSSVFLVVEGYWAAVDIHPIVNNGNLMGGINPVFAPWDLLNRIISPIVKDQDFEIWVMEKGGMVIFDQDSVEIGRNIFTDTTYASFTELISACQKIDSLQSGETSYSFYQTGTSTVVTKKTYWNTFSLHGKEWKLIWVKPE